MRAYACMSHVHIAYASEFIPVQVLFYKVIDIVRLAERFKDIVIEERKKSAQELFHFITRYPHLSHSAPFQHFIAVRELL